MKNKFGYLSILFLSIFSLYVSLKSFYNIAIYVDEAVTSPDVVLGGDLWVMLTWANFICLALIVIICGYKLIKKQKS